MFLFKSSSILFERCCVPLLYVSGCFLLMVSSIRLLVYQEDCWHSIFLEWEIRTGSGTHEHNPKTCLLNWNHAKKKQTGNETTPCNSTRSKNLLVQVLWLWSCIDETLIFHPEMEVHSLGRFEVLENTFTVHRQHVLPIAPSSTFHDEFLFQ